MKPAEAAEQFSINDGIQRVETFGEGHIHKTFLVLSTKNKQYILQELNTFVFKQPMALMENAIRIVEHLQKKVDEGLINWEVQKFLPLKKDGYLLNDSGKVWRAFTFIPHSPAGSAGNELYLKAGKAYGMFNRLLSDLPGPSLHETIPRFHDMGFRLGQFDHSIEHGNKKRIKKAISEIEFVSEYREMSMLVPGMIEQKSIPVRNTHNDAKIDNILFNSKHEVVSVIDLDTVMPGAIHSDFGDAIRTFGNSASEDEGDISRVKFNLDAFYAFSKGFMDSLNTTLTDIEKETLVYAPSLFAYMQAVRFLTDYLLDDKYYKVRFRDHNLIRAKNQFALLKSMISQEDQMKGILFSLYKK